MNGHTMTTTFDIHSLGRDGLTTVYRRNVTAARVARVMRACARAGLRTVQMRTRDGDTATVETRYITRGEMRLIRFAVMRHTT